MSGSKREQTANLPQPLSMAACFLLIGDRLIKFARVANKVRTRRVT